MSLSELLRGGFEHLAHDHRSRARALFEEVLASEPASVPALLGLAQVEEADEHPAAARACLERAVQQAPDDARVQVELGMLLARIHERGLAIEHLRRAVELDPAAPDALNNLGAVLFDAGRFDEAAASYRRAIELTPDAPIPALNLAEALEASGDVDGAIVAARTAATLDPGLALAWSLLGAMLVRAARPREALGPLRRAVELEPQDAATWRRLAEQLYDLDGDLDEMALAFERANAAEEEAGLLRRRGHVELKREHYVAAARHLERALVLEPDHPFARFHCAQAWFELGDTDAAVETLRAVSSRGPTELRAAAALNLAVAIPGAPSADHAAILGARRAFARTLPRTIGSAPRARAADGPLVIGYVSSFFHRRNWMKPVWGLVNEHDRDRVRVHLFSDAPLASLEAGYARHPADRFTDISELSNAAAVDAIRAAGIDVLVDLNGYSEPNRLEIYTRRPAPVVVGWFNLYATTGLDAFDVLVGDATVVRTEEEDAYVERIVRVPGSYLTFSVDYPVPDVAPAPCSDGRGITLGCLASAYKITDQVVEAWVRMLRAAPATRLLCRNKLLSSDEHRSWFAERFASRGIARERLELLGPCEHDEFLATYARIDVALDVFPYNGGTTTTEALWQGVPVATFDGDRWASRTSASLLNAAGLGEFVAPDVDAHVAQVVQLANDPDTPNRMAKLRANLRERLRNSPACDGRSLARALEQLYQTLHGEARAR